MADYFELHSIDFENSILKNDFIRASEDEWIWFIDSSVTGREEIEPVFEENSFLAEYDAVVFGAEKWDGEISLLDFLSKPQNAIYALGIKRKMLIKTGSFNTFLSGNTNYEFLLRIAERGKVYALSCYAEKSEAFNPVTMAYIIRKYMPVLKDAAILDNVFLLMIKLAGEYGKTEIFNYTMNKFLQDSLEYEKMVEDTAPFLIFIGNDLCAGILNGFACSMADELVNLGQAVITTDNKYGDYNTIPTDILLNQNYKGIIGFQTPAFTNEIFQKQKGRKIQFWLDNPIFFEDTFYRSPKDMMYLCQDAYYADFIKKHYGISGAIQFPPAGNVIGNLPHEKIYDVVFIGNYEPLPECNYENVYQQKFYEYMLLHPDDTFEQGVYNYGKTLGEEYDNREIFDRLQELKQVCMDVLHSNRHHIVETIVESGIKIHVFSENWELYKGKGRENLIIHPQIFGEEPFRVWAQSKIGFNMMRGHKAGMTERIANIMLCGVCCLSDETEYLKEYFTDGEDIVLFKRSELDELPQKIRYLLAHDEKREQIAAAGQKKAMKEHTWRKRTEQLLEMLHE